MPSVKMENKKENVIGLNSNENGNKLKLKMEQNIRCLLTNRKGRNEPQ